MTTVTAAHRFQAHIAQDVRALVRLGAPLLVNNIAISSMVFADTVMAGRLNAQALAGLAIGSAYYNIYLFIAIGALMALSPAVAHAYGARADHKVTQYFRQALWIVLALAVLLVLGLSQVEAVLQAVGIAPDVIPVAAGFVKAIRWGMPGLLAFYALRYTSEGLGITRPIMYSAVGGLVLNVLGNWIFIYGKFGLPALGAVGCGVSNALVMWFMFAVMFAYMYGHERYAPFQLFKTFATPSAPMLRELVLLGLPIVGSLLAEGGLFAAAALIMGSLGAITAGAHQIALNYAAFMFMVPLAVHSATTIHVGHALGRGDRISARRAGFVGMGLCAGIMAVSACGILVFNKHIAALYTRDLAVRELATGLLLMAALFQVSDGVQVGAMGALRGFKDTAVPMTLAIVSYWLVGFSLAYVLGVQQHRGPVFVWVGLIAGLTMSAVLLTVRYWWVSSPVRKN